jgi:hypothetical protein
MVRFRRIYEDLAKLIWSHLRPYIPPQQTTVIPNPREYFHVATPCPATSGRACGLAPTRFVPGDSSNLLCHCFLLFLQFFNERRLATPSR